jgi:hypothetical protein
MILSSMLTTVCILTTSSGTMAAEDRMVGTGIHAAASGIVMPNW